MQLVKKVNPCFRNRLFARTEPQPADTALSPTAMGQDGHNPTSRYLLDSVGCDETRVYWSSNHPRTVERYSCHLNVESSL